MPSESLRETIDSIIVALILAFVFRAFIVEAFVIPTGSMASTLNGAHGTMICRNCGWEFTYGLTDPSTRSMGQFGDDSIAECPNCRYSNPTAEINDRRNNYESGDRILVLKWTYDIGGATLGPKRWDVVVFKDPSDGVTNYIKRLAGLPNEVLQIVDGDAYAARLDSLSAEARETLAIERRVKYLRWLQSELHRRDTAPRFRLDELPAEDAAQLEPAALDHLARELAPRREALLAELDRKLRICRKTREAQHDLWRVVYDHDFPPRERGDVQPKWLPGDGSRWTVAERTLRFDGLEQSEQPVSLSAEIDSFCAYNTLPPSRRHRQFGEEFPVGDLRIGFVVDYRGGSGAVSARLTKRDDHFRGELSADGAIRLLHSTAAAPHTWSELSSAHIDALRPKDQVEFTMENLDYRVSLMIDGREVLATTDAQYSPNIAALRGGNTIPATLPPQIIASDMDVELRHVSVHHDIYYISRVTTDLPLAYHAWGVQNHPIALTDGEYFMLGDNSAQSKDSRLWNYVGDHLLDRGAAYQLGTVPHDQLIGRAFFVYWPSGLRTSLIPFLRDTGWIPNFGRMRWIR